MELLHIYLAYDTQSEVVVSINLLLVIYVLRNGKNERVRKIRDVINRF